MCWLMFGTFGYMCRDQALIAQRFGPLQDTTLMLSIITLSMLEILMLMVLAWLYA